MNRCFSPLLAMAALAIAATALAQPIPDPFLSTVEIAAEAVGASITVDPDGGGDGFTAAHAPGGGLVDATITAHIVYSDGNPAVNYPVDDMWLETTLGGLTSCAGWGTHPDSPTDENGMTTWQDPKLAGGCTVDEQVVVMVAGLAIAAAGLDLVFRSPDLDGDRNVNLSDIVAFTQMLAAQDACADFTNDGAVNLSDIVIMTGGIGASCEPAN